MDLYDAFLIKLRSKYEIVTDINNADLAFIPINYIKLIYGKIKNDNWHGLYNELQFCNIYSEIIPTSQPPTFGIEHKENFIRFFWVNFVEQHMMFHSNVPHFILYSYVLFETSFEPIDTNVTILSYEDEISFHNTTNTLKLGTYDRMIPIPYPLNGNTNYNFFTVPMIDKITHTIKTHNLTFIGTLEDNNRPLLKRIREFIRLLRIDVHIGNLQNIERELMATKYLFVLRGDTPTRICFYQCLAYNIVPIIFEAELSLYQKVFTNDINLRDSCLILPNKNNIPDTIYAKTIDTVLNIELSDPNNYINKIKNHEILFRQINYFNEECIPMIIALQKIHDRYA
jgi:hypothetical protein